MTKTSKAGSSQTLRGREQRKNKSHGGKGRQGKKLVSEK
jgi:hypothetical protein